MATLPSCRDSADGGRDAAWWRLEADRVELAKQVELEKLRWEKASVRREQQQQVERAREESSERLGVLLLKSSTLKAELEELSRTVASERMEWLKHARAEAVGRSFPSFSGVRGRTFKDVRITAITDIGIEFKHASGSARLAAADLTPLQQAEFGLDPLAAREALQDERAAAQAYGEWIDRRVAQKEAVAKAEREAEREAEAKAAVALARLKSEQARIAAASTATSSTRLRDRPRDFNRGNTIWYPGYTTRRYWTYGSSCVARPDYRNVRFPTTNWSVTVNRGCLPMQPRVTPVYRRSTAPFYTTP